MNDSPGWASPGSSPSDGERPGTDGDAQQPAAPDQPAQPTGGPKWSAEQPPPGQWSSPGTTPEAPQAQPQPTTGWGQQPGTPRRASTGPSTATRAAPASGAITPLPSPV